jgi:quercetin dioxygenase-like cupin family protein
MHSPHASSAGGSAGSEQPVTREILFDLALERPLKLGTIQARRIVMPANQPAGLHVHNGPVVGTVIAGMIVFQMEGETAQTLESGDVFYEPEGAPICRFDAGPEGATFLAFFPLPTGEEPSIEFPGLGSA